MAIPPVLDTFDGPKVRVEPELEIEKPSYDTIIVARVINKQTGAIIEVKRFREYSQYEEWAKNRSRQP